MAQLAGILHENIVVGRRIRVLSGQLVRWIPPGSRILDVGCGDGTIASLIAAESGATFIQGIDVLARPTPRIPVQVFDGNNIPYADDSFDVALLVDVVHHASEPMVLLREVARVARTILIKDHFRDGLFASATLRFMDWVGNERHGVALPYNYWKSAQWQDALEASGLSIQEMKTKFGLYPGIASWVFGRNLHFMARLRRTAN